MTVDRRRMVLAAGAAVAAPAIARAAESAAETVVVATAEGRLRGRRVGGVNVFKGVPYGASVSGPDRFKPARPSAAWSGVRDALALGTPSLQDPSTVYGVNEPAPGEDCLVLNVWAPAGGGRGKPVMFYSHGGGYTTGSGGSTAQDGTNLAREHDVVVVSTNHRLGLLGYLYLEELGGAEYAGSGNQGISDILLALTWVRRNIEAFGGDPRNVMIFGESGGGAKTSCLYAAPAAAPLFAKAAIQSGPGVRIGDRETAAATTRMVLRELGLAPGEWRRLLEVPGPAFLKVQAALQDQRKGAPTWRGWRGISQFPAGDWGPIVDGALLPHHPFDPAAPATARDKPLIVGWLDREAAFFAWADKDAAAFNLDEAGLRQRLARFGASTEPLIAAYRADRPDATPSDIYFAIASAWDMGLGSMTIAERKARQGGAASYYYNLAFRSDVKAPDGQHEVGAMHATDIPLVFDNVETTSTLAGARPERRAAAANISAMWANFARTGAPSAPGQPAWPAYDLQRRATMVLDAECRVVDDRWGAERRAWGDARPIPPRLEQLADRLAGGVGQLGPA